MSDGESFPFWKIKNIFNEIKDIKNIPKYYFIEVNSNFTNKRYKVSSKGSDTMSGTLYNENKAKTNFNGQLCECFTAKLLENFNKKNFEKFSDLRNNVNKTVEKITNNQQTIKALEYDDIIDKYTLIPSNDIDPKWIQIVGPKKQSLSSSNNPIQDFFDNIGFPQYYKVFIDCGLEEFDELKDLEQDDIEEMDIPSHDAIKICKAIKLL